MFVALLGVGVVAFNAVLMLSDRAPAVSRRFGGDIIARLSERLDAESRPARLATDPRLPSSDTLVHIGVWGVAMLLVGLAVWSWRGLAVGAAIVLACSAVIEVGQSRYTNFRTFEVDDLVANALGVGAGTVAAAAGYLLWSGIAQLFGAGRQPARHISSGGARRG